MGRPLSRSRVEVPLMPKGVEHLCLMSECEDRGVCGSTFDAERR